MKDLRTTTDETTSHLAKMANDAIKAIGYALDDALSKSASKSGAMKWQIYAYIPVSRRLSPRGTCDTLAVGQIAEAVASGHSRPGCFATPCHARTCARDVVQRSL